MYAPYNFFFTEHRAAIRPFSFFFSFLSFFANPVKLAPRVFPSRNNLYEQRGVRVIKFLVVHDGALIEPEIKKKRDKRVRSTRDYTVPSRRMSEMAEDFWRYRSHEWQPNAPGVSGERPAQAAG